MDKTSKPYVDGGYEDIFNAAESVNVVGEEAVLYSQSLERLRSMKAEGVSVESISGFTGLSAERIAEL